VPDIIADIWDKTRCTRSEAKEARQEMACPHMRFTNLY